MNRVLLLVAMPALLWTQGPESASILTSAGIDRVSVLSDAADAWRGRGLTVLPVTERELAARARLQVPGIADRPGLASPTRSPWINTNAWRFLRNPHGKFVYELPPGTAALAAAEAFAYGGDALLKAAPDDLPSLGSMFAFFERLPATDLPAVADFGVVDTGGADVGEVMNLLVRRNLLFAPEPRADTRFPVNVRLGTREYPRVEAADPSAFALKVRHQLTDERRSLRIYGSEVVIGRLTADATRARLHLLNYAGREIEGLRVRVRGPYTRGAAWLPSAGRAELQDVTAADGAIEFSIPTIQTYAVVDLER